MGHFLDSQGSAWTASYINEGGDVVRDRANCTCWRLVHETYELFKPDEGTKKTLVHLPTQEIFTQMFMKALDSMGKLTWQYQVMVSIFTTTCLLMGNDEWALELRQLGYIADPVAENK